ncbi:MAG: hypothetical protein U0223_13175 [Nitrospira sp.]|nr:hypothetical protein [Nitrospira sp.]
MSQDGVSTRRSLRVSLSVVSLLACTIIATLGLISESVFAGQQVPFVVTSTHTQNTPWWIDEGDVKPAGQSGRFIVRDRHITGTFTGAISSGFTITCDANVPLATQSGPIHARMVAGEYEANITLVSSLGPTPVPCEIMDGKTYIETPAGNRVPGLLLNGRINFLSGAKGTGNVSGWLIAILDQEGHITSILASQLTIAGQWVR